MSDKPNLVKSIEDLNNEIRVLKENFECNMQYTKILNQDLERTQNLLEVMQKHIFSLEKKNKRFIDRFKFGKFKPKSIYEEIALNKTLKKRPKESFSLNDD